MIEQLFGSRTRVKLLRLFLSQPEKAHYVRELTREVDERINSVRRELDNLSRLGLLHSEEKDKKKYYAVQKHFSLYDELRSLILKSHVLHEQELVERIKQLGVIQLFVLTGTFTGVLEVKSDMLIVGKLEKKRLASVIREFEQTFDREVKYTIMDPGEFRYRQEVGDTFISDILNSKHIVIIDTLTPTHHKELQLHN